MPTQAHPNTWNGPRSCIRRFHPKRDILFDLAGAMPWRRGPVCRCFDPTKPRNGVGWKENTTEGNAKEEPWPPGPARRHYSVLGVAKVLSTPQIRPAT